MSELQERIERTMRKIEDFYFGDEGDSGEQMLSSFAEKYSHLFNRHMRATEVENRLEHTLAYQEFQNIFEAKLDELVSSEGWTVDQFFSELKGRVEEDEDCAVFVQVILSISDYSSFVDMMASYCKHHRK
ncbi:unnamed protein product [Blepharisma stoltei]|uniref:Cilia- and flagella-associated protein 36 n=1 Tax=Blepharisma stoltei TaxID=1481888 RepID=A0AAU9IEH6_9CILI|nr:unnamed protein product [Blepharisma stoltei]